MIINDVAVQVGGALPTTPWELVTTSNTAIKLVLIVLVSFSLFSWFLIVLKGVQFRRIRTQGDRFFDTLERTTRLEDAYHAAMKLPRPPMGVCSVRE